MQKRRKIKGGVLKGGRVFGKWGQRLSEKERVREAVFSHLNTIIPITDLSDTVTASSVGCMYALSPQSRASRTVPIPRRSGRTSRCEKRCRA